MGFEVIDPIALHGRVMKFEELSVCLKDDLYKIKNRLLKIENDIFRLDNVYRGYIDEQVNLSKIDIIKSIEKYIDMKFNNIENKLNLILEEKSELFD
jgi:hypothetical protein